MTCGRKIGPFFLPGYIGELVAGIAGVSYGIYLIKYGCHPLQGVVCFVLGIALYGHSFYILIGIITDPHRKNNSVTQKRLDKP